MTDIEELIEGCRRNDRLAQKKLYERFFGKMMGVAMRYAGNREEAIELVNTAFAKVFQSWDKFAGGSFVAWAERILVNTAIDFIRKKNIYKKEIYSGQLPEPSIQNDVWDHLAVEEIYALLQKLDPVLRSVFNLFVVDGYSYREIAGILDISEDMVKWNLYCARKNLRAWMVNFKKREASSI